MAYVIFYQRRNDPEKAHTLKEFRYTSSKPLSQSDSTNNFESQIRTDEASESSTQNSSNAEMNFQTDSPSNLSTRTISPASEEVENIPTTSFSNTSTTTPEQLWNSLQDPQKDHEKKISPMTHNDALSKDKWT